MKGNIREKNNEKGESLNRTQNTVGETAVEEETLDKPEESGSMAGKEETEGEKTPEPLEESGGMTEKEVAEAAPAEGNGAEDAAQNGGEETEQGGNNAWEEQEDWEDEEDLQEDAQPTKPWMMMLVFLGLIAAAAVICVVLWKSTHADKQGEKLQSMFGENTAGNARPDSLTQEPSASPEPENTPDPDKVVTQDGRTIIFTKCDDMISPKEYVNLRTEPSTVQGEATVSCRLNQGEKAHRTGYNDEMGWSRVEYNDQILYVVTSYIVVVTDAVE